MIALCSARRTLTLALILTFVCIGLTPAQRLQGKALTTAVDSVLARAYPADGPGAAVLIARDGVPVYRAAVGLADLELDVPMRPEMVFRIGSMTKQFTAVAVLKLVEEGKLRLADSIQTYLPEYPPTGATVTVEDLLTHTSGIPSYTDLPEWLSLWRKDMTLPELLALFDERPLEFKPETEWRYNNSAYVLLGAIIERVGGKSYEEYLQEKIFRPLGLAHTLYDRTKAVLHGRVRGYQPAAPGFENAEYLSMTQPFSAGGLLSTVDDLLAWDTALYGERILKRATVQRAWTPFKLRDGSSTRYGYGWGIHEIAGIPVVQHGGAIHGFVCDAVRVPSERVYIVVLSNNTGVRPGKVLREIFGLVFGVATGDPATVTVDSTTLGRYTGTYRSRGGELRYVSRSGARLFSQSEGAGRTEIVPYGPDAFFIRGSATRMTFRVGRGGTANEVRVDGGFGPVEIAVRVSDAEAPVRREVEVDPAVLEAYVGEYTLAPGAVMTIGKDGRSLTAQMTGQPAFVLRAESDTKFFFTVVDATVEFVRDGKGRVTALMLHQGKRTLNAVRTP